MSQLDRVSLINKIDQLINTNGVNAITGARLNEVLRDLAFSNLNLITDQNQLGEDIGTAEQFMTYMDDNLKEIGK